MGTKDAKKKATRTLSVGGRAARRDPMEPSGWVRAETWMVRRTFYLSWRVRGEGGGSRRIILTSIDVPKP